MNNKEYNLHVLKIYLFLGVEMIALSIWFYFKFDNLVFLIGSIVFFIFSLITLTCLILEIKSHKKSSNESNDFDNNNNANQN